MKRRRGAMKHGVRHMKQPSAMKRGCRRIEKRNRQAPQGRWLWIPFPAALPPEMGNTKQNTLMQIRNTRPGTNLHRRVLFWRLLLRTSDTAQSGGLCCILSPSCGGSAAGNGIHSHRPYTLGPRQRDLPAGWTRRCYKVASVGRWWRSWRMSCPTKGTYWKLPRKRELSWGP